MTLLSLLLGSAAYGYHACEADLRGDWLREVPELLKACGIPATRKRAVLGRAALEKDLQRGDGVAIVYVERGWTHIYDPVYEIANHPDVWRRFTQRRRTRAIVWVGEGTTDSASFALFDRGRLVRSANNDAEKWRFVGKTLPEEHGGDWRGSPSEGVIDVVGRLGAPFTLYERQGSCTVFEVLRPAWMRRVKRG